MYGQEALHENFRISPKWTASHQKKIDTYFEDSFIKQILIEFLFYTMHPCPFSQEQTFLYSWSCFLGRETNKVMNASDKYYYDSVRVYWNSYRQGCSRKETLGLESKRWEECLAKSWRKSRGHKECWRLKAETVWALSERQKDSQIAWSYRGRLWPDRRGWNFKCNWKITGEFWSAVT